MPYTLLSSRNESTHSHYNEVGWTSDALLPPNSSYQTRYTGALKISTFDTPYNGQDNDDYEKMQFYYHPDHRGSSSYITNLDGEVSQHIGHVPFGEVFIEERNNIWNMPYLFNAKELDEETGMYYYGARYYDPRMSLWMSVDPISNYDPRNEENKLL